MATKADVERVLARVNRASDLGFFFDQLTSADWIDALNEAGLFSSPPGPVVEGDYIRYPFWAASRYLARVAGQAPEKVLAVMRSLPESGNPRIHEDITEAASSMPVDVAQELVPRVRRWIETDPHLLLLPERAIDLMLRLAEAGASDLAVGLAGSLFAVADDSDADVGPRVRTRLRDHDFDKSLSKVVAPLVRAAGPRAVQLFVRLLDDALRTRRREPEFPARLRFDDASSIWRRDVEDRSDREARYEPVLNALVDATYDGTKMLSNVDLRVAFGAIEDAGATIFRRIALQLIADSAVDVSMDHVARLLVDRDAMSDYSLELEYLRALTARAAELSLSDRRSLVDWIASGPRDSEALAGRFGDEWDAYLQTWQARRLAALGDAVPPDNREWASTLVAALDASDLLPVRPATVATWVGPTSPRPATELSKLPPDEVVAYLNGWEPSGEWAAPSREGLGRALSSVVAQRPGPFSEHAQLFVGLDPVYVRSLISGLRDAVKGGSRIKWRPVIALCEWVVTQELGTTHADWVREDRDPGWDWTWTEIARLLEQGLTEAPNRIPKAIAPRVRGLTLNLVTHPDPTPESEAQYGGSNMDPSTLSINTTRGEATHALVRLAWWEKKVLGKTRIDRGVRAALERSMTAETEPSLAVHSVFGRWFGTLTWVDAEWAASVVDRIFPSSSEDAAYWWAAWSTFVVFDQPTLSAHRLLMEHYRMAVDRLGDPNEGLYFHAGRNHAEALAGHLLAYVAWGVEDDPDTGLLRRLLDGPGTGRAELIEQAGRLLNDHGDNLDPSAVLALKDLWRHRRAEAEASIDDDMRMEIARFSWWCGASVLDVRWWLDELRWVVSKVNQLDAPFVALGVLPDAARVDPLAAVEVVDALSRMPDEPWLIQGHRDEVAQVLTSAISSTDVAARRSAIQLVHDLGAREVANFSELLSRDEAESSPSDS